MADYNTKTKYYFYKLYNDFFDMDVIEHLKRTETGSKTIIIYQQLITTGPYAKACRDAYGLLF